MSLRLRFVGGGAATVRVTGTDRQRTTLDVDFDPSTRETAPFAMLRSMYVANDNADVSEVEWQAAGGGGMSVNALPEVTRLDATQVRFGRSIVSRHNTSAPDIRFSSFAR